MDAERVERICRVVAEVGLDLGMYPRPELTEVDGVLKFVRYGGLTPFGDKIINFAEAIIEEFKEAQE